MWRSPKLLDRHNCGSKGKITEEEIVEVHSLARNTLRLEGCAKAPRWGLGWVTSESIIHTDLHKPTTSWLVCNWNTFGAWMNRGHTGLTRLTTTWTWGSHHLPFIVFSMISHGGYMQMSFFLETPKLGVPKFSKLGFLAFWKAITSYSNLQLRWGFTQSCSPRPNIFKYMWHFTCTHVFQGDSWLLMVEIQIGTLTPDPSFGITCLLNTQMGHASPF